MWSTIVSVGQYIGLGGAGAPASPTSAEPKSPSAAIASGGDVTLTLDVPYFKAIYWQVLQSSGHELITLCNEHNLYKFVETKATLVIRDKTYNILKFGIFAAMGYYSGDKISKREDLPALVFFYESEGKQGYRIYPIGKYGTNAFFDLDADQRQRDSGVLIPGDLLASDILEKPIKSLPAVAIALTSEPQTISEVNTDQKT